MSPWDGRLHTRLALWSPSPRPRAAVGLCLCLARLSRPPSCPQGVDQYCNYFKSIEDANSLRRRVSECFERAALPATPEEVRSNPALCSCCQCWSLFGAAGGISSRLLLPG